jgi:hypothetical protein
MRNRLYRVDDQDFEDYRANGGTMSRAEFFNDRLAHEKRFSDAARVLDSIGDKALGQPMTG